MAGFDELNQALHLSVAVKQLSGSTYRNYARQLAHLCLDYDCLPNQLTQIQVDNFLVDIVKNNLGPSKTTLKQTVFGIRYYFTHILKEKNIFTLPFVKQGVSLPVVLSQRECKILFKTPNNLKHRTVLALIYSGGLRISEAVNLKLTDIDFDRNTITIRRGKGGKDRCLPLAKAMQIGLAKYIAYYHPEGYLFYSNTKQKAYSTRSVQHVMSLALKNANINKPGASVHSLRHSFATHLLENGINIVQIQALMGHSDIKTTLIYTQLVALSIKDVKSPIDVLYGL